jgi:hypothetical protein
MLADIVLAILLVLAGLAYRRRVSGASWSTRSLRHYLAWAGWPDRLKDLGRKERWAPALAHPASKAGILLLVCIVFGWLSQFAVVGWEEMATFAPDRRDTGACWILQRVEAEEVVFDFMQRGRKGIERGKPLPNPVRTCPVGGRYLVDNEGYITCTRHGRAPGTRRVIGPGDGSVPWGKAK